MAEERERWISRPAFILAAIGSAVGLGNIWRFPYVAFQNGGGAFFIPYFIALISAGIPLMIVEYGIGQRYQGGAPRALAAVTEKFRWVGWLALLVGTTIVLYYVVVMGYAWNYAVASFNLAWTEPVAKHQMEMENGTLRASSLPPERIRLYVPAATATEAERLKEITAKDDIPVLSNEELQDLRQKQQKLPPGERLHYVSLKENVQSYFDGAVSGGYRYTAWAQQLGNRITELKKKLRDASRDPKLAAEIDQQQVKAELANLEQSKSKLTGHLFKLTPNLVIGTAVTWLIIFLIVFKGVKSIGKVVMVAVPLPMILLLILMIRGLTLPGAAEGVFYYLKPNWELLKQPSVWIAAYGQIFFSLTLGFGILIAYASYMPEESDVSNSAFITSFGNCATSFCAGLAVFSVLGYLAYLHNSPVPDVVSGGPGLVFVTYPIALAKMPMAAWAIGILSFMFFACLITVGIDSAFSIVEGVVAAFRDRFPRVRRAPFTAALCAVGFLGSLFFATRSGRMWLDIVDHWMCNYGLVGVGLLECIAVGYFFHLDELKAYINKHSEIKVHYWFDAFIKFVTPAVLIFLLGSNFLSDIISPYGNYDAVLSYAVTAGGWGVITFLLLIALILGRSWKKLTWALSGLVVFVGFFIYFLLTAAEGTVAELTGAAAMGAVGAVLLFGGLITCIHIAHKTGHPAGLSAESVDSEDEE